MDKTRHKGSLNEGNMPAEDNRKAEPIHVTYAYFDGEKKRVTTKFTN